MWNGRRTHRCLSIQDDAAKGIMCAMGGSGGRSLLDLHPLCRFPRSHEVRGMTLPMYCRTQVMKLVPRENLSAPLVNGSMANAVWFGQWS